MLGVIGPSLPGRPMMVLLREHHVRGRRPTSFLAPGTALGPAQNVGATRHNCQRSCACHLCALPRRCEAQLRWQPVVQVAVADELTASVIGDASRPRMAAMSRCDA